jgi:hypothetical protein
MDSSSSQSMGRTPFKDLTNTPTNSSVNATSNDKPPALQSWYARLPADKKAEYLEKQRMAKQQKKMAASISESSTKPRSNGQGWYARMTDEKKAEYLERQRISRQQKKMAALMKEPETQVVIETQVSRCSTQMPGNLMWVFPFYYFLLPVNIT